MENKKTNTLLIIIICILVVILLVVIGWGIGSKLSNKKDNGLNNDSNNTVEDGKLDNSNNAQNNQEKDYDIKEAKELVNKYITDEAFGIYYLFKIGLTDDNKLSISKYNLGEAFGDAQSISYDKLNSIYKQIFGKNSEAPKVDYGTCAVGAYRYDATSNSFIRKQSGCGSPFSIYTYGIKSATTLGNQLTITAVYGYLFDGGTKGYKQGVYYASFDESITYTYDEIKNSNFKQEFVNKYLDKMDTYEFIFKYEDNHYILKDIVKQ